MEYWNHGIMRNIGHNNFSGNYSKIPTFQYFSIPIIGEANHTQLQIFIVIK